MTLTIRSGGSTLFVGIVHCTHKIRFRCKGGLYSLRHLAERLSFPLDLVHSKTQTHMSLSRQPRRSVIRSVLIKALLNCRNFLYQFPWQAQVHHDALSYGAVDNMDPRVIVDLRYNLDLHP
jgi:hypothetical protein